MYELLLNRKTLIVSGVLFFITSVILIIIDQKLSPDLFGGVVAHQLSFTQTKALAILQNWGKSGQSLFLKTIWIDYLYPVFYSCFFASLIANKTKQQSYKYTALMIILPFFAAFFDMIENGYQIIQITDTQSLSAWFYTFTSIISLIKWFFLGLVFLVIGKLYINKRHNI